jgi:hypothetical protein
LRKEMDFKYSKKEELLQWAVNDFAQREIATANWIPWIMFTRFDKKDENWDFQHEDPEKWEGNRQPG